MTRRAGFTTVEIAIVMVIMAILMTLVVAGLRSTQQNGRNEDRKTDVTNIARALERFQSSGTATTNSNGRYPGTAPMQGDINDILAGNGRMGLLPDIDSQSYRAPDVEINSLVVATNANQTPTGVRPVPTIDTYVYQPLKFSSSTGAYTLCTDHAYDECRKFNLFYVLEGDTAVHKLTSKNQ